MSVKRYDFDCITSDYLLGASLDRTDVADGDYVLHSDYAALEAKYNALRGAMAKYFALRETQRVKCVDDMTSAEYTRYYEHLSAARAEVDRLLEEK